MAAPSHYLLGKTLQAGGNLPQREVVQMAKTEKRKKIVPVKPMYGIPAMALFM